MAGDTKNDFNSRLKRISEQRTTSGSDGLNQSPIRSTLPLSRRVKSARGVVASFLVMTVLPAAMLAVFFVFGQTKIEKIATTDAVTQPNLIQMVLGVQTPAPTPETNEGWAARVTGRMGHEFGAGQAAAAGGEAVAIETIVAQLESADSAGQAPQIEMFDANAACTLRRPQAGEKLVNVNVFGSATEAPVRVLHHAEVMDILTRGVKDVVSDGKSFAEMAIDQGIVSQIDVYVTDTSAPLHLMLQTVSNDMMWKIHAAPGVRIAHVSMIADQTSALIGNIGSATFEALRTADYGHSHEQFHGRRPADSYECMTMPFQKPDESWGAWEGAKGGNTMDGNLLFGQTNGFDAYANWYQSVIGQAPDTNLVVAASAEAVLVGPKPAAPFTVDTDGADTMRVLRADHLILGTPAEREQKAQKVYDQILWAAAGGDPNQAMPPKQVLVAGLTAQPEAEAETGGGGLLGLLTTGGMDLPGTGGYWGESLRMNSSMTQTMPFSALLKEGEAMPPEDLVPLYAMLRTPAATEGYCAETLVEMATSCTLTKVDVKLTGEGMLNVRTDFVYEPNYQVRTAERDHSDGFITGYVLDTDLSQTYRSPEVRRALLARAVRLCGLLREEYGNCAVDTSGFHIDRPARYNGADMSAHGAVWVSVGSVDNPFEESLLQARVDALWPTVN